MKVKQMPKYTSMAFMKQLALGREVRAPIIRVVIVKTVVTPIGIDHMPFITYSIIIYSNVDSFIFSLVFLYIFRFSDLYLYFFYLILFVC